jgi:hypothetical protein
MYLADRMSNGRPLITDNARYQQLLYSNANELGGQQSSRQDHEFLLVTAVFEGVLPSNLENVPLRDLLAFREKHGAARSRFHDMVASLASKVSEARNADELQAALADRTALIDEEKRILVDKLRAEKLMCASGLFAISVPSYILHFASNNPILIAGAAVAGISSTLLKFAFENRITRKSSPYSYLLDVENYVSAPPRIGSYFLALDALGFDGQQLWNEYRDREDRRRGDDDYDERPCGVAG